MTAMLAMLTAVLAWWIATGAVIALARQGTARLGMVMAVVTALALGGIYGLYRTLHIETVAGIYVAFFSALALWSWHETTFLLGIVTGPRRVALGEKPYAASRFKAAFLAVRDHELALAITAALMVATMHDAANATGLLTFLLLWVMRISTKLNIFLGARHAVSDMLPDRLSYLKSYFRTDRTSHWFWVSLGASGIAVSAFLVAACLAASAHETVMWSLLATFAGLALIEHLFLVLPVRDSALWSWAMAACPVKREQGGRTGRNEKVRVRTV